MTSKASTGWRGRGEILRAELPHLPLRSERLALKSALLLGAGRIETENEQVLLDHEGPLILVLNHLNNFEAMMTPAVVVFIRGGRKVAFLSDWAIRFWPVLGWLVRRLGTITVWNKRAPFAFMERYRRNATRTSPLRAVGERLAGGGCVAFYPEGRRNPDARRLLRGRLGAASAALSSQATVLPVGIEVRTPPGRKHPGRFPRLVYRFGEPIDFRAEREALRHAGSGRTGAVLRRRLERRMTRRIMEAIGELSGKTPAEGDRGALRAVPRNGGRDRAVRVREPGAGADGVTVEKVVSERQKADALEVVGQVYVSEKGWMDRRELDGFPGGTSISWFLAKADGEPAGLLRLVYDPPIDFPPGYDVTLRGGVDWMALAARARIVEVGRFMITEKYRTRPRVVMRLMNAATREVVERGYTHLLTDVFEGEPHSPLSFHTRVLGFERIGTHRRGEMKIDCTRIILALDIDQAYLRMKARGGRIFHEFTEGFRHLLEERVRSKELPDAASDPRAARL